MAASKTADQKLFSVILATYDCGRKVEDTLKSILSQNRELFELIVIDGASTDDTLDSIKKYDNGLTLVSEKDVSVYEAFNKAIDLAKGRYIYFIGAGDCLRPGVLEQVKELLPQEVPAFVYGNIFLKKQNIYQAQNYRTSDFIFNNICHQAVFYHRDIFDIIGKFNLRYKVFADWVLNLQCFTEPKIKKQYIPCLIADFEEGGLSSQRNNDAAFKKDFPSLIKKHLGFASYLKSKAYMINPNLYCFGYNGGYALKKHLFSYIAPYFRRFRSLKKKTVANPK